MSHEEQSIDDRRRWERFIAPNMTFQEINHATTYKEKKATGNSRNLSAYVSDLKIGALPEIPDVRRNSDIRKKTTTGNFPTF